MNEIPKTREAPETVISKTIAETILKIRIIILLTIILITGYFSYQIFHIKILFDFSDILPQQHQYVKTHYEFLETFGGANLMFLEVEVKDGDIFNPVTLGKIARLSEEVMFIPGVNRYKVLSIYQKKVKNIHATAWGVDVVPLMWPNLPEREEGLNDLRQAVYSLDTVYGSLVSLDCKSALIIFDTLEKGVDYNLIFNKLKELQQREQDSNTTIRLAGDLLVYGYVYHLLPETFVIFMVTFAAMFIFLFLYTRRFQFMIVPVITAILCVIWGLGFAGTLGYNLDPLILVIPLLVTARNFSHSIQLNERYIEEFEICRNNRKACLSAIQALFIPGLVAVITDMLGILILTLVPIPIMLKIGLVSAFWSFISIPLVLIFNPVLIYYFPEPRIKEAEEVKGGLATKTEKAIYSALTTVAAASLGKKAYGVAGVFTIFVIVAGYISSFLTIGDAHPGNPILWPDSEYNQDVASINQKFLGSDPFLLIVEGNEAHDMSDPHVLKIVEKYQFEVEKILGVGGTKSPVDLVKRTNMAIHEDDPKWKVLPNTGREVGSMYYMFISQGDPGDMDEYLTEDNQSLSITVYCKDHKGKTIKNVIEFTKKFINDNPLTRGHFKMCGGLIGVLAALNDIALKTQLETLLIAIFLTSICCALQFRSIIAGIILIIPLLIANFWIFAYMVFKKIGLNVNTLPICCIAIGIGVDYGIYLVSRIQEEYHVSRSWDLAITETIRTTGKAINYTGFTVIIGVVFWSLSSIRFQAEMGSLLALVTVGHLLGTLFLLPSLIMIIKPKFVTKRVL